MVWERDCIVSKIIDKILDIVIKYHLIMQYNYTPYHRLPLVHPSISTPYFNGDCKTFYPFKTLIWHSNSMTVKPGPNFNRPCMWLGNKASTNACIITSPQWEVHKLHVGSVSQDVDETSCKGSRLAPEIGLPQSQPNIGPW